jgi:hypothetical protein
MTHTLGRDALDDLLAVIQTEFDEMPGLALTVEQARRLWTLEPCTCTAALHRLVEAGYLTLSDDGHYVRPTAA